MAIDTYDFVWQQGEDGLISLVYKQNGTPVDLSTGYSVRMDVRDAGGARLFTFNSADIVETPPVDVTGAGDNEATLGSGGQINIVVPRAASLAGGTFVGSIGSPLSYDIFLRNTVTNKQTKLFKGTIIFEPSTTLWS